MKSNHVIAIAGMVALAIAAGFVTPALASHDKSAQALLETRAKISKTDAEQIALAKVPNGWIKEAELEEEHGRLQWSFDLMTPVSKDITEVNVDAITGAIISVEKEPASDGAKGGQAESAPKK